MSQEIETIKSRLNIVDLIGEYVRLQKAGNNWKACCPFHNEKTPSFSVSEDKQFWHCFGCGKGGDAFGFLMEIEGLTFREALENLAQRTGVELNKNKNISINNEDRDRVLEIIELATLFYQKQLWEGAGREKVFNYLQSERGLRDETIREFRLGYAPAGWRNLSQFLLSRGYKIEDIEKSGLVVRKQDGGSDSSDFYDRFRDRIMFPIANSNGKIIGYSARINPNNEDSQAKYINSPETIVYYKSSVLYGIDKAKLVAKEKNWMLLVEGNMDVIASWQAGIKNTVAISGTALTPEQLNIIKRYTKNIKMFFDMDEAGQKACWRSAQLAFEKELNVSIVSIEDGKDAADIAKDDVKKFIKSVNGSALAMEYFINDILKRRNKNDIEDKKNIIVELRELVNSFSNMVEREFWVKKIAEKIDVSENILFDEFNKGVEEQRRYIDVKEETLISKDKDYDKLKNIQIQIMGSLLSDDRVWLEAANKYKEEINSYFDNEEIKRIILSEGEKNNFNFEKFLDSLEDGEKKKFLRKLYFENSERSEFFSSEKERWLAIDQYFSELKRESKRRRSAKLIEEIKEAERLKNKDKIKALSEELMKINSIS